MSDPDLSVFNEFAFQTKLDEYSEKEIAAAIEINNTDITNGNDK